MGEKIDTKKQVTNKFIVGVVAIISSFVIAKLLLIPLFMFPDNPEVRKWVFILYILTWPLMFVGIGLAGWEGYRLATHKYREYKKKTVYHVKKQSKKAAKSVKKHTKKAAKHTKRVARKTRNVTRKSVNKLKRDLHHSERQLQKAAKKRHSL